MSLTDRATTPFLAVALAGLVAAGGVGAAAQEPGRQQPADPVPAADPLPAPARTRAELAALDARIGFGPRTVARALAALESEREAQRRAAALVALGASGSVSARPQLASWASEGPPVERRGAALGLGELRDQVGSGEKVLVGLLQSADDDLAGAALLALLRSGRPTARAVVQGIADAPGHTLGAAAQALLDFEAGGDAVPGPVAELYDLRFEAARLFGTVDGLSWSTRLRVDLQRDDAFLDHVVLLSAAQLTLPGVRDHLLELLLHDGRPVRVRACVRAMPEVVEELVKSDLWVPRHPAEWRVLLETALEEGVTSRMPASLERASRVKSIAPLALGLLAKDTTRYDELLLSALQEPSELLRERAALGIGAGGVERFLPQLLPVSRDPVFRVRVTALVARVRLGDTHAGEGIQRILVDEREDASAAERLIVLDVLHAASSSPAVLDLAATIVPRLTGLERAGLLATLHLRRRAVDLADARAMLEVADLDTPVGRRLIRALGYLPRQEDLAALARRFPIEGGAEGNLELALALVRNGHSVLEPVLQEAVWRGPWNRSVLAAAVVKQRSGLRVLEHWVTKPPAAASAEDVRRLGFAIGQWGGIEAVAQLTRRLGSVGADRPALQGALLGALAARTY